ncbi:PfaD family polyunsaturated fatty acid/polyketide biosynthesis protein [Methylobacterium sp. D54C]
MVSDQEVVSPRRPTHAPASGADAAPPRDPASLGQWVGDPRHLSFGPLESSTIARSMRRSTGIVFNTATRQIGLAWHGSLADTGADATGYPLFGLLAPLFPEWLGDRSFIEAHGLRFAYMGGSMARGIASTDLVIALGRLGALGMYGAAGMAIGEVEGAIARMRAALDPAGLPWGCNLIHSPSEDGLEETLVDLYLAADVRRIEASAFMSLSKALVRYACTGLRPGLGGGVARSRHVFAKISREEVAQLFMSPPPEPMLASLVAEKRLTVEEAALARRVPIAEQIIVESDSGGHTDNRPLGSLFPVIALLRDRLTAQYGYARPIHLGAAGGLGTPEAVAAAYALGAAFVVVGSVHQAAIESGISPDARAMLAEAGPADFAMTASADMFEMGVNVQVLSRGTMMPVRGNQLYRLYRSHGSIEEIAPEERARLERTVFRMPLDEVWNRTRRFFADREPAQIERAAREPKHRMALIFRWYVGHSSRWPIVGETERRADYQIWCGPAMGAFNRWTAGSFLERPETREVRQIALNLLEGAAHVTRAVQLRGHGLALAANALACRPEPLELD